MVRRAIGRPRQSLTCLGVLRTCLSLPSARRSWTSADAPTAVVAGLRVDACSRVPDNAVASSAPQSSRGELDTIAGVNKPVGKVLPEP